MFSEGKDTGYVQIDQIGDLTILKAVGGDVDGLEGVVPDWVLQVALSVSGTLYVPPVYQIAPVTAIRRQLREENAEVVEDDSGNTYVIAEWLEEQCPVAAATIERIRQALSDTGYPCVA